MAIIRAWTATRADIYFRCVQKDFGKLGIEGGESDTGGTSWRDK